MQIKLDKLYELWGFSMQIMNKSIAALNEHSKSSVVPP